MKIRSHIRSVRFVFSIFLLQILAGLTGCKDDGTEFLEKELGRKKVRKHPEWMQSRKTEGYGKVKYPGRHPQGAAADISQKKQNDSAEEPAPEVENSCRRSSDTPQTIYVDICGAVTSPGESMSFHMAAVFFRLSSRPEDIFRKLQQAISTVLKGLSDGQQVYVPTQAEVDSQRIAATQDGSEVTGKQYRNGERTEIRRRGFR